MATRRRNNEGTIFEDKEKGGYRVQLTAPDGKRISKRFKDPDEAMTWKNNTLSDFNKGTYIAPTDKTLGEWLQNWVDEYIKPNRKARTWEAYESLFNNHLKNIKNTPIQEIVPYHFIKAYNAMRKSKKSEATILKLHVVLHNAMGEAKRNKLISSNPIEDVPRPEPKKTEPVKLDEDDILKLLKALEGTRIYAGVYVIAHTGLRLGEVLGLRWKDVDFENGTISIEQNMQRSKSRGLIPEDPKTENSRRTIFVDEDVIKVLQKEQSRQLADDDLKNSKMVVCNRKGKPLEPRRFSKEFDDIRKGINMNEVTRHALRHAIASLLIDNNVPVTEVSAMLGHADQAFTFRRYVHPRKDATKKAAAAVAEILKAKEEAAGTTEDNTIKDNEKEVNE